MRLTWQLSADVVNSCGALKFGMLRRYAPAWLSTFSDNVMIATAFLGGPFRRRSHPSSAPMAPLGEAVLADAPALPFITTWPSSADVCAGTPALPDAKG